MSKTNQSRPFWVISATSIALLLDALHRQGLKKPVLVAIAVVCAMCRKAAANLLSDPQICHVLRSVWFVEPAASESMPGIVGRSRVKDAEEC